MARPTTPAPKNQIQVGMPLAPVWVPVCIITFVTKASEMTDRIVVTQ